METFSALLALCAVNSPVTGEFLAQRQWRGALTFSLICALINNWVNNREAGDLRRHRAHYDVIVIFKHFDIKVPHTCRSCDPAIIKFPAILWITHFKSDLCVGVCLVAMIYVASKKFSPGCYKKSFYAFILFVILGQQTWQALSNDTVFRVKYHTPFNCITKLCQTMFTKVWLLYMGLDLTVYSTYTLEAQCNYLMTC